MVMFFYKPFCPFSNLIICKELKEFKDLNVLKDFRVLKN